MKKNVEIPPSPQNMGSPLLSSRKSVPGREKIDRDNIKRNFVV